LSDTDTVSASLVSTLGTQPHQPRTPPPGPKGQNGWDFKYKDLSTDIIEKKISECPSVVGYELVGGDSPNATEKLLWDLDCRRIFKGYMDEARHRVRAMFMHQTLHTVGKAMLKLEKVISLHTHKTQAHKRTIDSKQYKC
jgi:hypothetical protein